MALSGQNRVRLDPVAVDAQLYADFAEVALA